MVVVVVVVLHLVGTPQPQSPGALSSQGQGNVKKNVPDPDYHCNPGGSYRDSQVRNPCPAAFLGSEVGS